VRRIRTGFPTILGVIFLASACSTGTKPVAPPPASAPPPTPTPGVLSRTDPTVVEETETYVIRRLAKEQYVKVDDRHIRSLMARPLIEFFKEDDKYYYISQPKAIPGEKELKESMSTTPGVPAAPGARAATAAATGSSARSACSSRRRSRCSRTAGATRRRGARAAGPAARAEISSTARSWRRRRLASWPPATSSGSRPQGAAAGAFLASRARAPSG